MLQLRSRDRTTTRTEVEEELKRKCLPDAHPRPLVPQYLVQSSPSVPDLYMDQADYTVGRPLNNPPPFPKKVGKSQAEDIILEAQTHTHTHKTLAQSRLTEPPPRTQRCVDKALSGWK